MSNALIVIILILPLITGDAHLHPGFYSKTCPKPESIVRKVMKKVMIKRPRDGASVLRLQFHDCFVNGCDGSVLLDDTPKMLGEKLATGNRNSLRSFDIIDKIKDALEKKCPQTVSCADIITMASRDAVALSGGPHWGVKLGRLDSLKASQADASKILPSANDSAHSLINQFARFNLTVKDMVALSGAHTLGKARCFSIMDRIYHRPDPAIAPGFRKELEKLCPKSVDQNITGNFDFTPAVFDNQYLKDLVAGRGFLFSDETLYTSHKTRHLVLTFSKRPDLFFRSFVEGMLKLGDLQSGRPGEVRRNCRIVNHKC